MKKLIIVVLIVVGVSTYAQDANTTKKNLDKGTKEMKSPEQKNEARLNKLTIELNLDANQQAQIKPIIADQSIKMEAMRAQQKSNKENNVVPSDADKKVMRQKRMEEKTAMDNKMKGILSSEQFVKYQAMQEAEKAKMKEQNKQRAGE